MYGRNQKIIPGELPLEKRISPGSAGSLRILIALVRYASASKNVNSVSNFRSKKTCRINAKMYCSNQSHRVTDRGSCMGTGIVGSQRWVPVLQNLESHRRSRLLSRAFAAELGRQWPSHFGRSLSTLNPLSQWMGNFTPVREFHTKTERR